MAVRGDVDEGVLLQSFFNAVSGLLKGVSCCLTPPLLF